MNEKTSSRLFGIGLLAAGVASMVTGHAAIAYFTGIASGLFLSGLAVAYNEGTDRRRLTKEEAWKRVAEKIKESENE